MTSIDPTRLARLLAEENAAFVRRTPQSAALRARAAAHLPNSVPMAWMATLNDTPPLFVRQGQGAVFEDVDGNRYTDFNLCDLSMTLGYGCPPVAAAIARQARIGTQYLMATEAAVDVAEDLARRCGLPFWQFTTTASAANTEVIRIARALTGRSRIVVFDGHYHGHVDETMVETREGRTVPSNPGLVPGAGGHTVIVPFNDLAALRAELARGDVALVLTEPALTNCLLVLPDPGFLAAVQTLCREHGTLLCYDEAHTFQFAYGGLVGAWGLQSDFIVLGKGFGTGISFALYGMTEAIGAEFAARLDHEDSDTGLPVGGTTYASALATVTARAALAEVLTPDAYRRLDTLGARLAEGLAAIFARHGLPWRAFRLGPRSGYCLFPDLPRTGREASRSVDFDLINARRVYMANRGVWDAIYSAGPQVGLAHAEADIDRYLDLADAFLGQVAA